MTSRTSQASRTSPSKSRPEPRSSRVSAHTSRTSRSFKLTKSGETVPHKDVRHLRDYFDDLDTDQSGTVDLDEMTAHMMKTMVHDATPSVDQRDVYFPPSILGVFKQHIEEREELHFEDMIKIVYPKATNKEASLMAKAMEPVKVATPPKLGYDKEEELDVEKMWVIWDKDASGELDAREFKDVLMDLGVGEDNPEEVAEVYRQVDTDGSGFISIDEFKHWWFSKRFS
ncbi:hypothetical protein CYMTET_20608 [Cymbomonas tetramitiformis]|uniref:EF-hand domain-containing protein n=1 Tax=Cymbomonas tetramitiformis TaxID=36881 RepID=A0AAE0G527_9CHLO|nr:hypothetical protein CYMTET_20608 [Cymbomonas tetramitiformis]